MDEINNPLEDIKVESALRSEAMKLNYRKANNPGEVNILDYTVIAALEKQRPKKIGSRNVTYLTHYNCPICNRIYWEKEYIDNYCSSCGQRLVTE